MRVPADRDFLIQAFIALGFCLSGWMIFVKPQVESLNRLEAEIATIKSQSTSVSNAVFEKIAAQAPRIRRRAQEIRTKGALAQDSSALYSQIRTLATDHDVQIKNVARSTEHERVAGATRYVVQRVDMKVEGEFEQIAMFLESLKSLDTYLRPVSLQVSPTAGGNGSFTVMQFGFESVRFNLPSALVALLEEGA